MAASPARRRLQVASALLSARLYADSLEDPHLRSSGIGVMEIDDALDVLISDGAAEDPLTRWMSRFRVAGALKQQLLAPDDTTARVQRLAARVGVGGTQRSDVELDPRARELDERLRELLLELTGAAVEAEGLARLVEESTGTWIFGEVRGIQLGVLTTDGDRLRLADHRQGLLDKIDAIGERLPPVAKTCLDAISWPKTKGLRGIDWATSVVAEPGGSTSVWSWVEFDGITDEQWTKLARLSDPRNWKATSIFWSKSDAVDPNLRDAPALDGTSLPGAWKGLLDEEVFAAALFEATLDVTFTAGDDRCEVTYDLATDHPSPDGLTTDQGYTVATRTGHRLRCELSKRIDFRNGPFGGPSAMDILAPSYIGSWLRAQQDLWIAHLVGEDFPEL